MLAVLPELRCQVVGNGVGNRIKSSYFKTKMAASLSASRSSSKSRFARALGRSGQVQWFVGDYRGADRRSLYVFQPFSIGRGGGLACKIKSDSRHPKHPLIESFCYFWMAAFKGFGHLRANAAQPIVGVNNMI